MRRHLPLGYCYAHAPADDARHIGWTSNGCAAGNTLEEAIVHGFLELVERDAAAIWWYHRLERPPVDTALIPPAHRPALEASVGAGWRHWLLDITHDLGIAVVVGVAHHPSHGWALGFGCAFELAQACTRALTELRQLVAVDNAVPVPAADPGDPGGLPRFLLPHPLAARAPLRPVPATPSLGALLDAATRATEAQGLDLLVLDHSRPDLPLRTVKVVVPGLCHIWPDYFTQRLPEVPRKMGWPTHPSGTLNPQALYV